jgi:hypothetical protein
MNELKARSQVARFDPNGGPVHHGHPPYWRRAHRDWRIWFCVILMLAAMLVYLMTGDLRWPIHAHRSRWCQSAAWLAEKVYA